jgi:fructose transport system substrate-binding protein
LKKITTSLMLSAMAIASASAFAADEIVIGLITKTETNPFFVKMK